MSSRSVIKRLELLEQRRNIEETPSLIMISYDEVGRFWGVKETFVSKVLGKNQQPTFKENYLKVDRIEDYKFKPEYKSRVIMDTFSNPDPNMHAGLICFDSTELWQDFEEYDGELCIETIRDSEDNPLKLEVVLKKMGVETE